MKKLFLMLFMTIAISAFAQNQINFESGNFDFLKDQTEVNVKLKFDNATYQEKTLQKLNILKTEKRISQLRKMKKFGKTGFISGIDLNLRNI